jgi:class 3 adenylate cyclase
VIGLSVWAAGASHTLLTWRRTAHRTPVAQLRLALYRGGPQADARRMLDRPGVARRDRLELEPSEAVRELQGAILRQEPELHASRLGLDGGPSADDVERATALTPTALRRTMPTGTVTFLFSDIEGSSALWEQAGTEMAAALVRHDEIVRTAINSHDGWIFSVGGDGFGVAFARAADALASAIDAQRALQQAAWPRPIELRVRIGIHTGEAEERDGTYLGHPVNVAARLMAAAVGGQILVSDVTAAVLGGVMGAELIDLGRQRLRGLVDPVGASCVRADGLAWVEPSLIVRDAFVGR